jgi:hypothetical protein
MRDARKLMLALLAVVVAGAFAACDDGEESTTQAADEGVPPVSGRLAPLADAPAGYSKVAGEAELQRAEGGTTVSLSASGLEPKKAYIAHLHTGGCEQADPGGPHFQFERGGSEGPPNEIHLEFTADADGNGEAEASSKREVPPGEAGSIVLHLDGSDHERTAYEASDAEAVTTLFVHEGLDHSQEGGHGEGAPRHAPGEKIACAELEGATTAEAGQPAAGDDVPTIVVQGGEPVDGVEELEYSAGEEIRFRVSSDQAQEIHVHGYDLSQKVPAGGTVEFAFPAELEGIYEVELEQLGVQIVELRVNP